MTSTMDAGLGYYREVLSLRAYRQEVLAADIANASTPGFKAVDLDFKEALGAAIGASPSSVKPQQVASAGKLWQVSDPRHLAMPRGGPSASAAASVKYQTDTQATLDGNSVDLDRTKVAAAANAVDYAAAATFTTQTIRMLMTAIGSSGSGSSTGA
jgi:flagellar basal-body rod protein FlgB